MKSVYMFSTSELAAKLEVLHLDVDYIRINDHMHQATLSKFVQVFKA